MSKADVSNNGTPSASSVLAELVDRLTARLHAGESINWEAEARAHPEHAAELRRLVPALGALDQLSRSGDPVLTTVGCGPGDDAGLVAGVLGDFRILREVGRGGMGIVYEAEQVSLGRRVALKVLPFAATMDPRQLQRFHNEARAAAGLHHTNIVPVYAVGCERGVHYYAMQFIDGRTLAEFIAQQRQGPPSQVPTMAEGEAAAPATTAPPAAQATSAAPQNAAYFRRVAEWGIQAAEALDCAHSLGVVHRDVKPANLLVDGGGRLWVTDFGLAQVQSDARLTMTGDLVGTLRYMSPEQALAKRVVIDHRTDVYSLGATLYEVLTLQPAFDGADRQELLRQIAFEEPKAPRRVNRAIPAELETIVLKALEKNPAERCATAQELADDLERWLKDEPIRARRPSLVHRARKWCRRHQAAAIGVAAALAAAVVLAVVMGFWYQQRLAETEGGVMAALAEAKTLVDEGDKQIEHPERWQATALRALAAQEKAEQLLAVGVGTEALAAQVRQVRATVDATVTDSRLLVELDRIRLEQAAVKDGRFDNARTAPLYAKLLAEYGVDLAAPEKAAARVRGSRLRKALLAALLDWSLVSREKGEHQRLLQVYALAVPSDSLQRRLFVATLRRDGAEVAKLVAEPSFRDVPPTTLAYLAQCLKVVNEWAAAEQLLRAGLERHPGDFWLNADLGRLLTDQQPARPEEAKAYLRIAMALRPDNAGVHYNFGGALFQTGDVEGAIRRYRAALEIDPMYASAHTNLGIVLYSKGRLGEAIAEYREALASKQPFREAYVAHGKLGLALADKGQLDEAIAEYRDALRLKEDSPEDHTNLGVALAAKGRLEEAIDEYRKALASKGPFPEAYIAHSGLGTALADQGRLDEAIKEHREAIRLTRDNARDNARAHCDLGRTLCDGKHDYDGAIAEFREALRLQKDYPVAQTNLGNALYAKGLLDDAIAEYRAALASKRPFPQAYRAHSGLGNALSAKGRHDEAIEQCIKAISLKKGDPGAHYSLGATLAAKGQLDQAIAEYTKALSLKKDFPEAHTDLGNALFAKGLLDEAIAEFQAALASKRPFPQAYVARLNLGNALFAKGRLDEANVKYCEALRLKEDYPEAHYCLGAVLFLEVRLDEAIAEYRKALGLRKDWPEARTNLGEALYAKGLLDEAIVEFGAALASKQPFPETYEAHHELGVVLYDKGRLDEAIVQYRKAIGLKRGYPDSHFNLGPESHFNLGNALYAKGRLDEAIVAYHDALGLKGNYPAAHYNLGIVRAAKGQLDEAFAEFVKANKLDPKLPDPLNALDWALAIDPNAEVCNPRQAVALARKAVQAAPNQGDCWKTLGVALYRACDSYSAVAALMKSMELRNGGDATERFFLAMAQHEEGRRTEARQHYDKAIAWMERNTQALKKNPQGAEELRRLREEAEQVLELKKK
jgi:tetratricopeptide (TPR) repeat protein